MQAVRQAGRDGALGADAALGLRTALQRASGRRPRGVAALRRATAQPRRAARDHRGPAAERALFFEPASLVDQLLDEVADLPGALPLLSFLLSEMYRASIRRPRDRTLSEADHKSLGGVSGALSQRADRLYESYATPEEKEAFRYLMLRMVAPARWPASACWTASFGFPTRRPRRRSRRFAIT